MTERQDQAVSSVREFKEKYLPRFSSKHEHNTEVTPSDLDFIQRAVEKSFGSKKKSRR